MSIITGIGLFLTAYFGAGMALYGLRRPEKPVDQQRIEDIALWPLILYVEWELNRP